MKNVFQTDRPTDGPTDRRTDGRTHPLIESWFTTKNQNLVLHGAGYFFSSSFFVSFFFPSLFLSFLFCPIFLFSFSPSSLSEVSHDSVRWSQSPLFGKLVGPLRGAQRRDGKWHFIHTNFLFSLFFSFYIIPSSSSCFIRVSNLLWHTSSKQTERKIVL